MLAEVASAQGLSLSQWEELCSRLGALKEVGEGWSIDQILDTRPLRSRWVCFGSGTAGVKHQASQNVTFTGAIQGAVASQGLAFQRTQLDPERQRLVLTKDTRNH